MGVAGAGALPSAFRSDRQRMDVRRPQGELRRAAAPGLVLYEESNMRIRLTLLMLFGFAATLRAQSDCQEYRLEYHTVYDEQQVTAQRVEYEDVLEERKVTSYRPVWETEVRQQRRTVLKPVYETSEREERYFVEKPVWEERIEDRSYERVRNVFETDDHEQRVIVNRPVYETQMHEESYVVRRPVFETAEREETYTVMEPVTTYRPVQVDQGGFAEQQVYYPGPVRNRLTWQSGACVVNPATGQTAYQRGGLFWQAEQQPGVVQAQRVWIPNIVTTQVPQTTLMPRTAVRKVPVQVCRYEEQQMVRKVPVQVCRMEQHEEVRRVPVTVCKQVVERVENKVPVRVCRMERQEMVRKVAQTTVRYEKQEQVEEVPVRVCRQELVEQTVQVPVRVEKRVPVTYTYRVPRTVLYKVPIDPCGGGVLVTAPPSVPYVVPGSAQPPAPATGKPDPATGKKETFGPNGGEPHVAPPKDKGAPAADEDPADTQPELPKAENPDDTSGRNDSSANWSPALPQRRVVRSTYAPRS